MREKNGLFFHETGDENRVRRKAFQTLGAGPKKKQQQKQQKNRKKRKRKP